MKYGFQKMRWRVSNLRLHPLMLIFAEILIIGIVGGLILFIFQPRGIGYLPYEEDYSLIAYLSILYSTLVIGGISYKIGLPRKLLFYAESDYVMPSDSILLSFWNVSFFLTLGCLVWLFVQADMRHPLLSALGQDNVLQVAVLRSEILKKIDMRIYNLGLIFFQPLNLIISIFLLRSVFLSIASLSLLFLLGTFTLAKAPIIYILIFAFIFRMLFSPLYFRNALKYLGIISLSLILLFISTKYATFNSRSIVKNIGGRILYGEISELPYYFEIFSIEKVNIKSLMPPYLVGKQKPAARIVAEYSVDKKFSALPGGDTGEKALYARVAGVANTFFTGEAFAWAGYPGVILSPFIVMAHLAFYIYLFKRIKKTWLTVYVFSFFLYKVFIGSFGGISYFIFSSMHIILIALLMLLVSWRYLESRNIPFFNRIANKLCIL